jgi:hypothetical protein
MEIETLDGRGNIVKHPDELKPKSAEVRSSWDILGWFSVVLNAKGSHSDGCRNIAAFAQAP